MATDIGGSGGPLQAERRTLVCTLFGRSREIVDPAESWVAAHRNANVCAPDSAAAASLEDAQHRNSDGRRGRLVAFPNDVEHRVSSKGFGVVFDADRSRLGGHVGR